MAIKIGQEFERTSKATRFKDDVMTKAQMLACTDDNYSDGYLVVEKDSHDLYIYDVNATPSAETGKFVKSSGSGGETPNIEQVLTQGDTAKNKRLKISNTSGEIFSYIIDNTIETTHRNNTTNVKNSTYLMPGVQTIEKYENNQKTEEFYINLTSQTPTVTMTDNVKTAFKTTLDINGSDIQVTTLPTASATEEGNIYQYVGATDSNYTNGYFYQCQEVTPATDPKTYEWVQKDVQSSELPEGGTTGQILAKNSDDDGDAGWIVDTGKDLNKLVQWGTNNSQSPRTEYVPEITDSTVDPYHRVILHIPIQGSALQGIEATEESLKNCLKTRFKIRYNTDLNGTVVFTTTTEDTAGDLPNSFGMKTNLTSGYADSRLDIYLNETTISNNTLHLAVNYYVKFSASQTNHHGKPQNVVLLANDGYTFGVTPVGEPYYVHNSTKIALDDLQINDMNIPTSWGVAKTGNLKMYMTNKQSYQYLWFGNLGFSSVDDYVIFVDITGGMEAGWGKPTVLVSNKSAKEAGISLECDSAEATWFNVNYVIIGKGYGNITSGGGGGDVPENIVTARATLGAGDVDIYSMTGISNEYTPVEDKVTMDLRVIQGGTYSDLPEFNISTAGAGNPIYSKHLATTDYVDTEVANKQDTLTGGTTGQILAKKTDENGNVEWIEDIGRSLTQFDRKYGIISANIPITVRVAEFVRETYTYTEYRVPYGGIITSPSSISSGILNTFDAYVVVSGYSESKVKEYVSATSSYRLENSLMVKLDPITQSGNYAGIQAKETSNDRKVTSIRLVARGDNNFGMGDGTAPYDIRNLTGMVLDDLRVTGTAIPTDWGIAGTGCEQIATPSDVGIGKNVDISGFGLSSVDDYEVSLIVSGGTGARGGAKVYYSKRSETQFSIGVYRNGSDNTRVDVSYTIFAKGYGNNRMQGGGGSLPAGGTTGQALVKKSNTDGDVEWKTVGGESTIDKIEVNGVEQPIVNKTVDIEVPEVSMQSYDNMSITPAGASSGFVFNANTDNVTVTTESGTRTLPTKSYVDSKSPTIVNEGATFTNAQGNQQMEIRTGGTNSVIIKDKSANGVSEYWSYELPDKDYVDTQLAEIASITGDLTNLTTDNKDNLVNAINEVYEKSGEPFRVKNWASSWSAGVSIDPCTTDKTNANLSKMTYSIDAVEGADYQIVGMIAYEVFDNTSGGNRLNVWPVCQFTGNGQKELSVRWVCAGTTVKTAKRINAWVLLKHR